MVLGAVVADASCFTPVHQLANPSLCHWCALQLADERFGVIGLKWKETSCDKLGEVDDSSPDSDSQSGGSSDDDQEDSKPHAWHEKTLEAHSGWDTTWIKQKVKSWGSRVNDDDFEKRWQSAVDGTWLDKFKEERPSWVK